MLFNSIVFLIAFLPLALIGFHLASKMGRRPAGVWLILVSVLFYGWERPEFMPVLILSMAGNFAAVSLIAYFEGRPRLQNAVLTTAIVLNLAALFRFKYLYVVLMSLAGIGVIDGPFTRAALPLGISFFTFTQIGYLIDFRQGVTRDRGVLNYLMFVSFFPHLIAGPILHNREIMPQFADPATYGLRRENLMIGFTIFVIGLAKKCLLADPLSATVVAGFHDPATLGVFSSWNVALSYSLQLYFDFSGYSDMAIGLARLFNVRFPLNFNSPYKAASVVEYWQRWHMTLTRYITLYLYNPVALFITRRRMSRGLGVGRREMATPSGFFAMTVVPTFFTMGLAGIWHGAGSQFVIFGLLHAFYLSVNHGWRTFRAKKAKEAHKTHKAEGHPRPAIWAVALTYLAVLVGAVFFRAPSSGSAVTLLSGMLGLHGFETLPASLSSVSAQRAMLDIVWLGVLYAVVWGMPNTQQIMRSADPALGKVLPGGAPLTHWRPTWQWAVVSGAVAVLAVLGMGGTSEFLYFQF